MRVLFLLLSYLIDKVVKKHSICNGRKEEGVDYEHCKTKNAYFEGTAIRFA
jgi:hypothetical protein